MTCTTATTDRELRITRVFDAPRELVWRAWTDPELGASWGPDGMTMASVAGDVRPGGEWRTVMVLDADGARYVSHGVYREVDEPARLVFTFAWETGDGSPEHEMLVTVELADLGGRTEMTFHQAAFASVESRDGHAAGWNEAFDSLAGVLARVG